MNCKEQNRKLGTMSADKENLIYRLNKPNKIANV